MQQRQITDPPYLRRAFLAVAGVATVGGVLLPAPWQGLVWGAVQVAALGAVIMGARRHGVARSPQWRLMIVSVGALALCRLPLPFLSDLALLIHLTAGLAALLYLSVGTTGAWRNGILDTGVITVGLGLPYWAFLVDPMIHGPVAGGALAAEVAEPLAGLVMLALVARMALTRRRAPWLLLVAAAQLAQVLGDGVCMVQLAGGHPEGALPIASHVAWTVLIAAAALHPSVAGSVRACSAAAGTCGEAATIESGRALLPAFFGLTLLSPLLTTVTSEFLHKRVEEKPYEHVLTAFVTAALATLLVLRMQGVTKLAERRAAALDRQADQLATQAGELTGLLDRQQALQRQLAYRAHHDPLTGLANRIVLNEQLAQVVAEESGHPPALLMLDLDGFKDINDTFGHPVGDELLVQVGRRLTAVVPEGATTARLGGDEFAVLLPGTGGAEADAIARQVLQVIRTPYPHGRRELRLSGSIGLLADVRPADPDAALRDADLALLEAKNTGKNRIVRYDAVLREARTEHGRLIGVLHDAWAQERFTLHYQPVVELPGGRIWAAEALLRWMPGGEPPMSPARFIPLAEETGMIVPLGAWVLDEACAHAARNLVGHNVACSVNISGRQLIEEDFAELVLDTLRRHRLPAGALILEITESILLTETTEATEQIIEVLGLLRDAGVRIALDDFGTGYSSLSYLRILPVDILKVDRSFMAGLGEGHGGRRTIAFTKAILDLAASLELDTIAEGVETAEQAALLEEMGCRLAQGYHFARPAPQIPLERLGLRPALNGVTAAMGDGGQDLRSGLAVPMD